MYVFKKISLLQKTNLFNLSVRPQQEVNFHTICILIHYIHSTLCTCIRTLFLKTQRANKHPLHSMPLAIFQSTSSLKFCSAKKVEFCFNVNREGKKVHN